MLGQDFLEIKHFLDRRFVDISIKHNLLNALAAITRCGVFMAA